MTLLAKLTLPIHLASSFIKNFVFFHYNNLIYVLALSSVRNSNKFSFDTLTNLQQSLLSMVYEKRTVSKQKWHNNCFTGDVIKYTN